MVCLRLPADRLGKARKGLRKAQTATPMTPPQPVRRQGPDSSRGTPREAHDFSHLSIEGDRVVHIKSSPHGSGITSLLNPETDVDDVDELEVAELGEDPTQAPTGLKRKGRMPEVSKGRHLHPRTEVGEPDCVRESGRESTPESLDSLLNFQGTSNVPSGDNSYPFLPFGRLSPRPQAPQRSSQDHTPSGQALGVGACGLHRMSPFHLARNDDLGSACV